MTVSIRGRAISEASFQLQRKGNQSASSSNPSPMWNLLYRITPRVAGHMASAIIRPNPIQTVALKGSRRPEPPTFGIRMCSNTVKVKNAVPMNHLIRRRLGAVSVVMAVPAARWA
ncbi:hypothetical protein BOX17_14640 [Halomonas aestuarii]|uniref:Uncharacterized protein n=1 Tax=Halomonas aestuarii TaxID=1897729 RepID=A0A1J0VJ67_9GAMM|nr:hypothetical protein BOX17_14640 [Halomonas aestuarii]